MGIFFILFPCYNIRMPSDVLYELTIGFQRYHPGQIELTVAMLLSSGVRQTDIVELHEGMGLALYYSSKDETRKIQRRLKTACLKNITLSVKTLHDADWRLRWKENFRSFAIVPGIRIVPLGRKDGNKNRCSKKVIIDTDSVFGTGLHPTTQMTARFIYEHRRHLKSFLDVGCGSGILSLIAARLGAKRIGAIDISRCAVRTARRNFALNGVRPDFVAAGDIARFRRRRKFNFVAANVLTEDLIRMKKKILSLVTPGGLLAVSGISGIHYDYFLRKFTAQNITFIERKKKKDWTALLYKKKKL